MESLKAMEIAHNLEQFKINKKGNDTWGKVQFECNSQSNTSSTSSHLKAWMANTISMFPLDRFSVWYFPARDFQLISTQVSKVRCVTKHNFYIHALGVNSGSKALTIIVEAMPAVFKVLDDVHHGLRVLR